MPDYHQHVLCLLYTSPLHGFIIRKDFEKYINAYLTWARYESEENGVLILYASPYGNTKNAAEILACELAEGGVTRMKLMDVSHWDPDVYKRQVFSDDGDCRCDTRGGI